MKYPQRGRLDTLNMRERYESPCPYSVPEVPSYQGELPSRFVAWPNRKKACPKSGIHFFVDDTRFEPVWTNVDRYRQHYEGRVVCSPDFSMYTDWPFAACLWNTYRARWLARAMAERGALVIPAVTWGRPETFPFAFLGLQRGGSVAISAYGAKRFEPEFRKGYEAMIEAVAPSRVIVVGGTMPAWLAGEPKVIYFPANTIADRRKAA
jgi:hypothetical protein